MKKNVTKRAMRKTTNNQKRRSCCRAPSENKFKNIKISYPKNNMRLSVVKNDQQNSNIQLSKKTMEFSKSPKNTETKKGGDHVAGLQMQTKKIHRRNIRK